MESADGKKDYTINLPGGGYTWEVAQADPTNPNDQYQCYVLVKEFTEIIFGTSFITNFVTTFDLDTKQISLTANANASTGVAIKSVKKEADDDSGLGTGAIVGIIIGAIVVLVLIIGIIFYCKGKGKKDTSQNYSIIEQSQED